MHAIFMTRGIQQAVNHLSMDMQAQKFPCPVIDKETGQKKIAWIQGALRPIQLWEYVFPKEDLDIVLNTLEWDTAWKHGQKIEMCKAGLRKIMGAKKAPPYKKDNHFLWVKNNVDVIPIGIKEDVMAEFDEVENGIPKKHIHESL